MARRKPGSVQGLDDLGRVRLGRHFLARPFLYSTIGDFYGIQNIPDDPDLFIAAGTKLCTELLDPIYETFGGVEVRSAYRSPAVNAKGQELGSCASNEANRAGHIWDQRDANGAMGATASIVVPWFARRYERGREWQDLAWWVHDHLPYAQMEFYPQLAAFNISWHETERATLISSYAKPRGHLYKPGTKDAPPDRAARYADFPPFCGLADALPQ